MKKLFFLFIFLILINYFAIASPVQVTKPLYINTSKVMIVEYNETETSDQLSDWNETFDGNENKTFYIKIPKHAVVKFAYLNVSGYKKCTACKMCAYDPGTGPDCRCPTDGLSSTEQSTLNTSGSCPGGCSACSYTPSCSNNCQCQSPYSGGGISSCYSCSYTPGCPDCDCPSPGSGGGIYKYECTYTCSGSKSLSTNTGTTLPTPNSGYYSWSCSAGCSVSASNDGYCSDGETRVISHKVYVETAICSGSRTSCSSKKRNAVIYSPDGGSGLLTCRDCNVAEGCADSQYSYSESENCNSYSCSPGESLYCYQPFVADYEYSTLACSGAPCGYFSYIGSCSVSWSYKIDETSTSKCGASPCQSGEDTSCDTASCSCYSCHSCSYTPSPPCTCTSPYSGGGCKSCHSCSYTPSGPDCTCASPGSGGSCPGGCEVCGYTPDLDKDCVCQSPYSGGGCANYEQPKNPWLDSLADGKFEWEFSGYFNETAGPKRINLNETAINEWLSTCTPDEDGNCLLPVVVHSDEAGKMRIYSINISYEYNLSKLYTVTEFLNVVAGENITREFHLNNTGLNSPVNVSIYGYYLPFNGTEPITCEVNGAKITPTIEGSYVKCPHTETISYGSPFPDKVVKWYKGVLVTKTQTKHYFYNTSAVVDEYIYAYFNISGKNSDTVGYDSVTIRGDIPLPAVYFNTSPYIFTRSLSSGETYSYTINISGKPVRETTWTISSITYTDKIKYTYIANISVYDGNVSGLPIIYYIPTSRLVEWSKRNDTLTEYYVDTNSTGFYVSEANNTLNITIPTNFSSSSLDKGDHSVTIIYYVPYSPESPSIGGGGGGWITPRLYVSPSKIFMPIYLPKTCNSTNINITWLGSEDVQATIVLSDELKNITEQPKDGERILLKRNTQIVLPVKICVKDLHQGPVMVKGYSGSIEIVVTMKTGGLYRSKIPVEVRVYAPEVPPAPAPPPKPTIPENLRKAIVIGLIIVFAYIVWKYF